MIIVLKCLFSSGVFLGVAVVIAKVQPCLVSLSNDNVDRLRVVSNFGEK